ncbi:hypothetical protein BC827DRAFT_1249749, partial [Russula dissimulans]
LAPSPTTSSSRLLIPAPRPKTAACRRTPASPEPLTRRFYQANAQASPGPIALESRTCGRRLPWVVPLALAICRS